MNRPLRFVGLNRTPDPRRIPESLTKLQRAFSFRVEIRGFDLAQDAFISRFVQVSLDEPLTRAQIQEIGAGFIFADEDRYKFLVDEVLLVSGTKAGAQGTFEMQPQF